MSELIQNAEGRKFRWALLLETSALTLMGYLAATPIAKADDNDRPTVWIELGGQLTKWESSQDPYAPPFTSLTPSNLSLPQKSERPPRYGIDENAALILRPNGSDWNFSASIRFGRSGNSKKTREQSNPASFTVYSTFRRSRRGVYRHVTHYTQVAPIAARFSEVMAKQSESHVVLDFQAGKDLGIGIFGRAASSVVDVGVRFAQFTSRSRVNLQENPDWQFKTRLTTFSTYYPTSSGHFSLYRKKKVAYQPFHSFVGSFQADRSVTGLGPSISWKSSQNVAGSAERGSLAIDWGVNASLLFGRQKVNIHHQTTGRFHATYAPGTSLPITYQPAPVSRARSHSVVIPNIGGFAGFSVKYPNAKVSFGYKADIFFFGAMDGGIDVRRTEDVGFHGPYASVSIGLGG